MTNEIKERWLLYKLRAEKDPDAFAALYDTYVKQIYRFVYFKVSSHEEAEDITSEVFLKVWNYLQEKKEIKSFSGLLYRIARNCIIDFYRLRTAKSAVALPDESELGDAGRWHALMMIQAENQTLLAAVKKMKQEYQEVIMLKYVDELETDEIAAIMGKGKIAVRVTLHRALKKLQAVLDIN